MISHNSSGDPRRPNKIVRYRPSGGAASSGGGSGGEGGGVPEDPTPEYMNVLGMIFSMCGLMMRLKWCAWMALLCSCVSFANARAGDDAKQILSSFMLSISAVVMCYLQNPQPITPPWASLT